MFHPVCAVPAFSLTGFEPYDTSHVETSLSQAHLDALSRHLDSALIVDGLPGSPQRPCTVSPVDSPEDMTHLTFYPSDDDRQMSLLIDLKREGHQLYVFNIPVPKDNNLLFRGVATAMQAACHWNDETRAASNAETFLLRRTIESKLSGSPMARPVSMPDMAPAAGTSGSRYGTTHDTNQDVTHGMIHGVPHRLTRGLGNGVKRPYPW
jgi:hypothetical protein